MVDDLLGLLPRLRPQLGLRLLQRLVLLPVDVGNGASLDFLLLPRRRSQRLHRRTDFGQ